MEKDFKDSNNILRKTRTPKVEKQIEGVRESLLSDSTSGICRGDDDSSSIDSISFSSVEIEVSTKEKGLLTFGKRSTIDENCKFDKNAKGIGRRVGDSSTIRDNRIRINNNSVDLDKQFQDKTNCKGVDTKTRIPDGGWGWVVVTSSFVISMIADGISFSFGLLYIEFLDEFKTSKSTTAWIGSLFIAVPLLSGPIMSALVDRYGCRSMTILGGIISALGFALASVSKTIEMMMITFGVIAGLGLGLVYVTAVVSIAYWFEKKRNLAVGLGACGTGVGTFVYAPMTQYFIDEYGWRGTILLLSGTLLNLCVCGCVMRDPEWWIQEQKRQRNDDKYNSKDEVKSRNSSYASVANPYVFDYDSPTRGKGMKRLIAKGVAPEKVIKDEAAAIERYESILQYTKNNIQRSMSVENLPTYLTYDDKMSKKMLENIIKRISIQYNMEVKQPSFVNKRQKETKNLKKYTEQYDPPGVAFINQFLQRSRSEKHRNLIEYPWRKYQLKNNNENEMIKLLNSELKDNKSIIKQDSKENRREWLKKQLSVNHHYLKDLKMPINSISHRNAMLNIKRYRLKASSCPDIFKNSMITINEKEDKWNDDLISCFADMFNVALLKKATFDLMCFGTLILFIWFIVPYFYLAEHMIHNGYSEDDGATMLSLIGITNTIGMVGLGWIGDFPKVSIGNLYAFCLILCGVSVAAIPAAVSSYWILASISSAFGLLFAASFTFTPSLLVQLVSLDDFTSAYGLVLLAQGIGHLIGPPLSGLIYDLTLSWELAFYLAGGWIIISGILISFIQPVRNYQSKRKNVEKCDNSIV
ncbi:monocarboxylate transporter 14-like [Battus philenor]|uniref:monocarboxylate transporter 14-like n=1 Tax=Battus philenor TaxID=42288 RepID=UPI0035D11376